MLLLMDSWQLMFGSFLFMITRLEIIIKLTKWYSIVITAQALASHHHSAAPTVTRSSVLHQVKELEQKPHNTCSSPMGFAHGSAAKEQCLPPLTSITNSQLLPGSSVPAPSQPSPPVVNLQSLAKYTDKSFTNLTSGWPVELIEKQVGI